MRVFVTGATGFIGSAVVRELLDAGHEVLGLARSDQAGPAVVRFPRTVHGRGDHGFIARLIDIARDKGVSGYPGDGSNRWPAVHRLDAAHLFRLAVESAPAGARLHGVGEEGIPVREIADVIGRGLRLPVAAIPREEVAGHFGFLGAFFSLDCPASSALTQQLLGWHPAQPGLIADLEQGHYFERKPVAVSR